jgi:rRNA maturation endonuclease Nob1
MGGFMILLYEALTYKLRREDVPIIERETGKPVQELTEDELVAAMKRKGIQQHEVTPEDRKSIARSRTKARYCIYCGARLASDGGYCPQCGHQTTY